MLNVSRLRLFRFESLPFEQRPEPGRLLILIAVLLLAAGAILPWDLSLSGASTAWLPGDLRRVVTWSEAFAHGLGVALIGLVTILLDHARRRYWPRILLIAYGAGLAANVVKLIVVRIRPSAYLSGRAAEGATALDTFQGWLPALSPERWGEFSGHAIQSFPSAHTATAAGFAGALWTVYPRARPLFVSLAILSALQRVAVSAHYPSDVLVGAAVGCAAAVLLGMTRPVRAADGFAVH